jgi:RNA polymerase sigma factor (TIGR02999 family)
MNPAGDPLDVTPEVYETLRLLARRQLRKGGGNTLDTTGLVHEAWIKLSNGEASFESHAHFLAVAAKAMRQILVDHARRRGSKKRGENPPLSESILSTVGEETHADEILLIDAALTKLEELDARLARVVEWRFFGGLEESEIARGLDVDVRTVRRDWRKARAFIVAHLAEKGGAQG